jgi:hypothetical protein
VREVVGAVIGIVGNDEGPHRTPFT